MLSSPYAVEVPKWNTVELDFRGSSAWPHSNSEFTLDISFAKEIIPCPDIAIVHEQINDLILILY